MATNGKGRSDSDRQFQTELLALLPYLRSFAHALTHNQDAADDLAQEVAAKAWRARTAFDPGTNFKAWLSTILRNQFYSDRRRAWREAPWDQEAAERIPSKSRSAMAEQQAALELKETLRGMADIPYEQEQALMLVGYEGLSYEQAAEIQGCAVGTVKSRVARARKALREIMGYEEAEFVSIESLEDAEDLAWKTMVDAGALETSEELEDLMR